MESQQQDRRGQNVDNKQDVKNFTRLRSYFTLGTGTEEILA
jgi:hypothetical protein